MVAPSSWEIKTANNSDGRPRPSRSTISSSFRLPVFENRRERLIDAISLIRQLQTRHSQNGSAHIGGRSRRSVGTDGLGPRQGTVLWTKRSWHRKEESRQLALG